MSDQEEQERLRYLQLKSKAASSASSDPSFLGINRENLPQTISNVARPVLEMGGSVGGGLAGLASPVPGGAAMGGALGFAGGQAGADLLDRMMGLKQPIQNVQQAAGETLGDLGAGAKAEMMGQIGGKVLEAGAKPVAKFAGNMGRMISGVNERAGERLFKDPGALFSPSVETAGKNLGAVRNSLGINTQMMSPEDVLDRESTAARRFVKDLLDRIQSGGANGSKVPLSDLVKGSQSMDDIIEATPMRQQSKRAELFKMKNIFTDELKNVVPEEREAANQYSRSALASNFRKLLPVTKGGDVSVTRTLGLGLAEGGGNLSAGIPAVLAQSPALSGLGISGSGVAYKALQNPTIRRAVVAALQSMRNRNQPQ